MEFDRNPLGTCYLFTTPSGHLMDGRHWCLHCLEATSDPKE